MFNNCDLQKFFKRRQIDMLMFGYVNAVKKNMPSVSTEKAMKQFIEVFDIDEGIHELNTLLTTYKRMQVELIDVEKAI